MKLFVYGTLMSGFHNHRLLKDATFIEKGITSGYMISLGGFPAVYTVDNVDPGDMNCIHGELYEIDEKILAHCDRLEGYRGPGDQYNFYDRVTTSVYTHSLSMKNEGPVDAFMYEFRGDTNREEIESGCWRTYVGQDA
jgi:gamma-glutamylcyclotransferase (GGCT)/AIG2-like uncharacterized protein YtfP